MNAIALILLFILFIGLLAPISFLTYLLFVLPVFGSLALLPPELIGSNLTPGSVAALFFIIKALGPRPVFRDALRSMTNFKRLGFLSLFLIVAVLGSYALPRIFEGALRVYTMRTSQLDFVAPTTANYTQAAYLILSTLTAVAIAALTRNDAFMKILPKAILAGGYAVILTGLMDIVANLAGLSSVLGYFRNASYVFMVDNVVEGTRRVIGLMPEASSYGGMAAGFCGLLLFLRPIYPQHLWRWRVPLAGWGCGLMALLSTSSTAYAMMAIVLLLYAIYNVHKVTPEGKVIKKTISKKILAAMGGGFILLIILVFDSDLMAHFVNLVDVILFQKQNSSSYADRMHTTEVAFDAFFASDGIGIGVGSVRASNFFVNILASTGVLGMALFILFLRVVYTRRAPKSETRANVIIRASKLAIIPIFVGAALSGTTPDFGLMVGILFGLIIGLGQPALAPASVPPPLRKQSEVKVSLKRPRRYI